MEYTSSAAGACDHSLKGDILAFLKFLAPKLPVLFGAGVGAHYGGNLGSLIGGLVGMGIVYVLKILTTPRRKT